MTKLLDFGDGCLRAMAGDLEPFTEQDVMNVMDDITLLFRWKESKIARTTLRGLLIAVQENFPTTILGLNKAEIAKTPTKLVEAPNASVTSHKEDIGDNPDKVKTGNKHDKVEASEEVDSTSVKSKNNVLDQEDQVKSGVTTEQSDTCSHQADPLKPESQAKQKEVSTAASGTRRRTTASQSLPNNDTSKKKISDKQKNAQPSSDTLKKNARQKEKQPNNNGLKKSESDIQKDTKRLSVRLRNISPLTVQNQSDSNDSIDKGENKTKPQISQSPILTSNRVTRSLSGHLSNIPAKDLLGKRSKTPLKSKSVSNVIPQGEGQPKQSLSENAEPVGTRGRQKKEATPKKKEAPKLATSASELVGSTPTTRSKRSTTDMSRETSAYIETVQDMTKKDQIMPKVPDATINATKLQNTDTSKHVKVVLDQDIEEIHSTFTPITPTSEVSPFKNFPDDEEDMSESIDVEEHGIEESLLFERKKPSRSRRGSGNSQDDMMQTSTKRAKTGNDKNENDMPEKSASIMLKDSLKVPHSEKVRHTDGQKAVSLLRSSQMGPDKRQFDLRDYLCIHAAPLKRRRILELADVVSIDKPKAGENVSKGLNDTEWQEEDIEVDDEERLKPEFTCMHCSKKRGPSYMRNSKEKEYHESCHAVLDDVIQTLLYKCPYCGVLVKGWGGFLNHAIKHEAAIVELEGTSFLENVPFKCKCEECGKQFFHKKARDKHRSEVHSKQLVSCNICKKKLFANKPKEVLRHLDICRNIIYRCDYCEYLTVVRADMRTHMGYHDKNPVCEICHMGFPNKFLMETHKANLHNWKDDSKQLKCAHCEEHFRDDHGLKKHRKMYHSDKEQYQFECNKCSFVASTEDKLLDHDLVAHQKEYQCSKCNFGTDSEISLEQHMEYHKKDGKYPCAYENCGFLAVDVSSLNKHVEATHLGREFICPFCSKSFKKKVLLDRHVPTHPTAKTYKCGRCDENFNLFSDYHRHKETTGHDSQPGMPSTLPAYKALHSLESEEDQLVRLLVASVHVSKESSCTPETVETAYKIQTAGNNLLVESDEMDKLHGGIPDMIASIPAVQVSQPSELHAHKENDDTFEAASVLMDLCGKQQNIDPHIIECPAESSNKKIAGKSRKSNKKVTLVMSDIPDEATKSQYPCPYCKSRAFLNLQDLKFHISSHVESEGVVISDTYRCQFCTKICTKWLRFLHHLAIHRENHKDLIQFEFMQDIIGSFECETCHKVFEHRENLKLHQRYMHKGTKEYTICDICNQTIYSLDIREIDRHLDNCRQVTYRCDFCEYTTVFQNDMKSHSLYHSSGFKCKKCQVTFYSKADLVKHQAAMHSSESQVNKPKCQICGDSFISKKLLHTHLQENHEDEVQWTNVCEVCGYKASTLSALQKHTKNAHPKIKMQCYICRYKTFSEASLIKHMKEHEKKKRELTCGINGCEFTTFIKDHLRAHQKSVHAERNHICPVCGKGFKRKPALHRHIVNHPERKSYTCGACRKVFTKFSTYEMHKEQTGHDAERPVDDAAYVPQDLVNVIKKPQTLKRTPAMPKKSKEKREQANSEEGNDQVIIQTNVNGQAVQYILKMEPGTEIQGEDLERSLRAIADLVQSEHNEAEIEMTDDGGRIIQPKMESNETEEPVNDGTMTYTAEGFAEVLNAVVTGVSQFESSNIDVVPTVSGIENELPTTTVTTIGSTEPQQNLTSIEPQQSLLKETGTEPEQSLLEQSCIEPQQSLLQQSSIEPQQSLLRHTSVESQRSLQVDSIVSQQHFDSTLLEAAQTATSVENLPPTNMHAAVSLLSHSHSTGRLEAVPSSSSFQRYIITGNEATSVTAPTAEPAVITKLNTGQQTPIVSVTGDQETIIQETEDGSMIFTSDTVITQEEQHATQETADELMDFDAEALLSGVQGEGETIELSNGEKAVSHLVTLPDGRQVVVVMTPETSEPEAALSMLQLHGQDAQ